MFRRFVKPTVLHPNILRRLVHRPRLVRRPRLVHRPLLIYRPPLIFNKNKKDEKKKDEDEDDINPWFLTYIFNLFRFR